MNLDFGVRNLDFVFLNEEFGVSNYSNIFLSLTTLSVITPTQESDHTFSAVSTISMIV